MCHVYVYVLLCSVLFCSTNVCDACFDIVTLPFTFVHVPNGRYFSGFVVYFSCCLIRVVSDILLFSAVHNMCAVCDICQYNECNKILLVGEKIQEILRVLVSTDEFLYRKPTHKLLIHCYVVYFIKVVFWCVQSSFFVFTAKITRERITAIAAK